MHFKIFNADRIAIGYISNITMADLMTIDDDHQAAADRFHLISFQDKHARILA